MRLRLRTPSPALVVSVVALVVALGGTSYAAFTIGTNQIRNGAVTNAKLAANSVGMAKIRDGAVSGSKMNFNNVQVPSASFANYSNSGGFAYGLYRVQYVVSGPVSNPVNAQSLGSVVCPTGTYVLGGGALGSSGLTQNINSSYPVRTTGSTYPNAWFVKMNNAPAGTAATFNVFAICERIDQSTTSFTTRHPAKR